MSRSRTATLKHTMSGYTPGADTDQVRKEDLRAAVAEAETRRCPFYAMLTAREKDIVNFMDLLHPLPAEGEQYEEVMDVCDTQVHNERCCYVA